MVAPTAFPEHWSKDFVEHLRTVHFALVTVSVGLILLLSSAPYDAIRAATQMSEISQTVKWLFQNPSGITNGDPYTLRPYFPFEGIEPVHRIGYSPRFQATFHQGTKQVRNLTVPRTVTFHIAEPNLLTCFRSNNTGEVFYSDVDPAKTPDTLRTFASWWDNRLASTNPNDWRTVIVSISQITRLGKVKLYASGFEVGDISIESVGPDDRNVINLIARGRCEHKDDPIQLSGNDGEYEFVFDVVSVRIFNISQLDLHNIFNDVRPGPFEESFSDLANAARGREDEEFATLAPQVFAEASKGTEAFEAFGVKFPGEQVTRWGIVILIGVQLYLVMYLRLLSNKLKQDDPGWEVPWMAMDQSLLAQTMLFVSVVVLPTWASVLAIVHTVLGMTSNSVLWHLVPLFNHLGAPGRIQLVLMCIGFCISVTLGVLCWKYRPRLSKPVARAQLFE